MSVAWNKVKQEVANLLGAVAGVTAAAADTNYVATIADGTLVGPDFTKSQIEDALVHTLGDIVEAIASTPLHPEAVRFQAQTSNLAEGALIPRTDSGGNPIIGPIRAVRDTSDSRPLIVTDLDKIRSFSRFASTVYSGFSPYWYAIDGYRIWHTRANVIVDVFAFSRPTSFAGNIPVDDIHERGLVCGAVAALALKEGMFNALAQGMAAEYMRHLQEIRAYGRPMLHGMEQAAASTI